MEWIKDNLTINSRGKGLHEFTSEVQRLVHVNQVHDGLCHLFLQHTSASLCITENADPTARKDLEEFIDRLAPENQDWHQHTLEGSDDSPSHMKAIVTKTSESIPVENGRLMLGTWQGIYLFEHRHRPHRRHVLVHLLKIA
ncbi:MAG: secondary thiamine-phosphate synthase enzyme YjbQ [Calditrichaeota bacterium]|nr:secondary thiamine-phosphate synthase enzyme YjbQ [Calditrichota bacterium]